MVAQKTKRPYYYEQDGMMLHTAWFWEIYEFGIDSGARGDASWRTGMAFFAYGKKFSGALYTMLKRRIRYLGPKVPHIQGKEPYIEPKPTSKDQFPTGIAAMYLKGCSDVLKTIRFPFILSSNSWLRPDMALWIKFLKTGSKVCRWGFHQMTWLKLRYMTPWGKYHMFSIHNQSWMMIAAPNKKISALLLEHIPKNNILLRLLNLDETLTHKEIHNVVSKEGWQWQWNDWLKPFPHDELDPEEEDYCLDADVVFALYEFLIEHTHESRLELPFESYPYQPHFIYS